MFEAWDGEEVSLDAMPLADREEPHDASSRLAIRSNDTLAVAGCGERPTAVDDPLEKRFARIVESLGSHATHSLLGSPVSEWSEPGDISLPFKFLSFSIRHVLEMPFDKIAASWTTQDRLTCLIEHLERAARAIESVTGWPDESATEGDDRAIEVPRELTFTGRSWRHYCDVIERHQLHSVMLGTIAPTLNELPTSFWKRRLGEFLSSTLLQLSETPGVGPQKMRVVVDVFRELAAHLETIPAETHLAVSLLVKPIQKVNLWLEDVLSTKRVPDLDEIAKCFLRPLASQLQADLSPLLASLVLRRSGFNGAPETLEEIATDIGVSRARVWQIAKRATEIVQVRWPHGKHLLDDLDDLLRSTAGAEQQLAVIRTILDRCFDVDFASGATRADILDAWQQAGRKRLTPMTEDEVTAWLSQSFPRISPHIGLGWITPEAPQVRSPDGKALYFSDEPYDRLLLKLYETDSPLSLAEATDTVDGDERSIAGRLGRDPRFVELDDKTFHASYCCSIKRLSGRWQIGLKPLGQASPRLGHLSIEGLVQLVVSGMTQAKIVDATVWGVHRFANESIGRLYGAVLPDTVSPFVLQNLLVEHSDDVIRRMRRRRLRWDSADNSLVARGKLGWMAYAVRDAGCPMTMEEVADYLRRFYQDYEFHAFQQLAFADDEEGDLLDGVTLFNGISHRIPPIVSPDGWRLDLKTENVSIAIKRIASKVVDIGRVKGFPKSGLDEVPWLVDLIDHYAYGKMNWTDEAPNLDEIVDAAAAQRFDVDDSHPIEAEDDVWRVARGSATDDCTLDDIIKRLDGLL